jgi:hypothetical protein
VIDGTIEQGHHLPDWRDRPGYSAWMCSSRHGTSPPSTKACDASVCWKGSERWRLKRESGDLR